MPGKSASRDNDSHSRDTGRSDAIRLLKIREVAEWLRVSDRTVYRLIAAGELPKPLKIGGSRCFQEDDVLRYLDQLRKKCTS